MSKQEQGQTKEVIPFEGIMHELEQYCRELAPTKKPKKIRKKSLYWGWEPVSEDASPGPLVEPLAL